MFRASASLYGIAGILNRQQRKSAALDAYSGGGVPPCGANIYTGGFPFDPEVVVRRVITATQFSYLAKEAKITEVKHPSDSLQITATVIGAPPASVALQSSPAVAGPYTVEPNARMIPAPDGDLAIEVPLLQGARFFRLVLN